MSVVADRASEHPTGMTRRATTLFLTGVIGVAFVGFVVGIRQGVPAFESPEFTEAAARHDPTALPATRYADFDRRLHGPNRAWRSALTDLAQPEHDPLAPVETTWSDDTRRALLAARAARRAYDGAPPVVPHPIDQMTARSCAACHVSGLHIADVWAPAMSHEFMHNCTQCHVEQWSHELPPAAAVASLFRPLAAPVRGSRAWEGAPPTIPHPTFMRDNCMSCHGPSGPEPIRTSHPWRVNCLQCHAPSATLDQGVVDSAPAFLPPLPVRSR